jgi:site-specific DNA-methyltransferase (adenine-specific)
LRAYDWLARHIEQNAEQPTTGEGRTASLPKAEGHLRFRLGFHRAADDNMLTASRAARYLIVQTDSVQMLPALPDGCVDAVVTDPPWNRGKLYGSTDDEMPERRYVRWLREVLVECARVSHGRVAVFLGQENGARRDALLHGTSLHVQLELAWQRSAGVYEAVALLGATRRLGVSPVAAERAQAVLASTPEPTETFGHPCPKPVEAVEALVELTCPPDGVLLDPFLGVGSTLLAAQRRGRAGIGMERDPAYCRTARQRLVAAALWP